MLLFTVPGQLARYGFIITSVEKSGKLSCTPLIADLWIMIIHISVHTLAGIAKQVLDRCVICNPETNRNNEEFEVVFDYSFVEDHQVDAR